MIKNDRKVIVKYIIDNWHLQKGVIYASKFIQY